MYRNDYDWDVDGFPGEYVYGEDVYVPDEYMEERWKQDVDISEYWVSTKGRVWSTISNSFIYGSPVGRCGHIDISLRMNGKRVHKYLHRMVAEAFIPNPHNLPMVRHLDDNPNNNCVENLAWGDQFDNVSDSISNGHFRYLANEDRELAMQKRRMPIKAIHIRSGREYEFDSQQEASRYFGISQTSISDVINGRSRHVNGYYFCREEDDLPRNFEKYKYVRHLALIRAVDNYTGERFIFHGQTEAAKILGMSISAVSMVLSGKMKSAKGYSFEYIHEDEGEYDGNY